MEIPGDLIALNTAPEGTEPAVFLISCSHRVLPLSYQFLVFDAHGGQRDGLLLPGGHNDVVREQEAHAIRKALDEIQSAARD